MCVQYYCGPFCGMECCDWTSIFISARLKDVVATYIFMLWSFKQSNCYSDFNWVTSTTLT